jgi:RNA polymerase sigma-70 factor (ECF subfamily)
MGEGGIAVTDEEIIRLFEDRSEQAVRELDKKYGKICRNIANRILCDDRDAEECVSEAYLTVWDKIPPEKPTYLLAYVGQILRLCSLRRLKYNSAPRRLSSYDVALHELEECLASPDTVEQAYDRQELTAAINDFLAEQSPANRALFLRRYLYGSAVKELAKQLHLTEKGASERLRRMRLQLRTYLNERGFLI